MKLTSMALELYTVVLKKNIIYAFSGKFHYSTINFLLSDLKEVLTTENKLNASRKTYRIAVECLENAYKYSLKSSVKNDSLLSVSRIDEGFNIQIGNLIDRQQLKMLKEKIDIVNSKDTKELKTLYRESILKSEISDKGGAGIGIIDVAIKSSNKINYSYVKHEDDNFFFAIDINIK